MESYEEFTSRTLKSLLSACGSAPAVSAFGVLSSSSQLRFSGRRLLEPVLSADQRVEMEDHRHTALQRDRRRPQADVLIDTHLNKTDSPSACSIRGCGTPDLKRETLRLLNQRMENLLSDDDCSLSLSLSVTGSYARLPTLSRVPGPQASCSPRRTRARHIIISSPNSQSQLGEETISDGQLSIRSSSDESEKPRSALNRSYDVENPCPSLIRPQVEDYRVEQMCDRLKRDDVHQISDLLTEQHRQTLQVQQEGKLNEQSRRSLMKHSYSSPALRSTQHTCGTHTSHTQEKCVDQMEILCRLTAAAQGFLTRRLLQTYKITHLRKTIQDSRQLILSFQTDSQLKRLTVSNQDLSLQQRVTAQLRAALLDVHQIFFVWPLRDRLKLLQQDRERRQERTRRDTQKDSPVNTRLLSSATQRTLDRKIHRQTKKLKVLPKSSAARRSVSSTGRSSQ